jgi:preprotein translocase subunit SecF
MSIFDDKTVPTSKNKINLPLSLKLTIKRTYYALKTCIILHIYLTIFGCCNSLSSDISLIAVDGMPSSSLSSLIFFIATI